MKEPVQQRIIAILSSGQYVTSGEIAEKVQISSKTVQKIIRDVNEILKEHGAAIISKRGRGYLLQVHDMASYNAWLSMEQGYPLPSTPEERIDYLIWDLIQNGFSKLQDISDRLFVSIGTLTNDMKILEEEVRSFGLGIVRKPYYGMTVEGPEYQKRKCLKAHYRKGFAFWMQAEGKGEGEKGEEEFLASVTQKNLQENELHILGDALKEVVAYLTIGVLRIDRGCLMEEEPGGLVKNEVIARVAEGIAQDIREHWNLVLPEQELRYIELILSAKQTVFSDDLGNITYDYSILEIVNNMIEAVYEAFGIDFGDDLELKLALCQHLVPLEIRLKSGISSDNPMLDDIRREYPLSNTIASFASKEIHKSFQCSLDESEVGYIALSFALAMERKAAGKRTNICIVTSYGRLSSNLIEYRMKDNLNKYVNQVKIIDISESGTYDFSQADYVFTMEPIKRKIDIPIIQMGSLTWEQQEKFIINIFKSNEKNSVVKYFDKALFLYEACSGKQEILEKMCGRVEECCGKVGLLASVLRREQDGNTIFYNRVALTHPDRRICPRTCVCVAVLRQPVYWEAGQMVQVVFLVCLSEKDNENLEAVYRYLAYIIANRKELDKMIASPTYETFIDVLNTFDDSRK